MKLIVITFLFCIPIFSLSQNKQIYNPNENAQQKIDSIIHISQKEHKFVLLQIGGNWCIWCLRFNKLTQENENLKKILDDNYLVYHVNYSKENKNEKTLSYLGHPERFGFPVFVILNEKGERIHTQQSDFLEDGISGYDIKKVITFLEQWSPKALDPKSYSEM